MAHQDATQVKISNCANYGSVSSSSSYEGAMTGRVSVISMDHCVNFGTITGPLAAGDANALIGSIGKNGGTSHSLSVTIGAGNYIFTDLDQHLFSQQANNTAYSTELAKVNTVPSSETVKGDGAKTVLTALDFENTWVTRENDYPMPKVVYDNFFKIDVKYWQNTTPTEGTYAIRIIAEVSGLEYQNVGFEIEATYAGGSKSTTRTTQTVYKSISADYGQTAVSARDGRYFVAIAITDIPTSAGAVTFEVTPIGNFSAGQERGTTVSFTFDPANP